MIKYKVDNNKKDNYKKILSFLASLGIGLLPGPRGTYASIFITISAWIWFALGGKPLIGSWYILFILLLIIIVIFIVILAINMQVFGNFSDPNQIIIDEIVGQIITFYGIANPGWELFYLFVIFRFFDIVKPWPIKIIQKIPNGWGVIMDDICAGLYTLVIVNFLAPFC